MMLLKTLQQQWISILFLRTAAASINISIICLLRGEEVIGVIR